MIFGLKVHHSDIDGLLALGPDAVEFALFPSDMTGEWVDYLKVDQARFSGQIVVHASEKHSDGCIVDAGAEDEVERLRAVAVLRQTIDIAVRLKARSVICHPGGVFRERRPLEPNALLKSLGELKAYAAGRTGLLLENMPWFYRNRGEQWHSSLCSEPGQLVRVLEAADVPLCLDVCHAKLYANATGSDFDQIIRTLLPYTRHIHVADAAGTAGEGLQIDTGEIDFSGLRRLLGDCEAIVVPEIDDGFKDDGLGFRIARDRLKELGYF